MMSIVDMTVGRVRIHEHYDLGGNRYAFVAQNGSRWFVLRGPAGAGWDAYTVSEPYDAQDEASGAALRDVPGMEAVL